MIKKFLTLFILATVVVTACSSSNSEIEEERTSFRITQIFPSTIVTYELAKDFRQQLTDWRNELQAWLDDKEECEKRVCGPKPFNVEFNTLLVAQTEVDFYDLLLIESQTTLDVSLITPEMKVVITRIIESYDGVLDHTYSLSDTTNTTRISIQESFGRLASGLDIPLESIDIQLTALIFGKDCAPFCTQYGLPDSNSGSTGFGQGAGDGDGDWYDELDEGIDSASPDDVSTHWASATNPSNACIATTVNAITDPATGSGHIIKGRGEKTGSSQIDATINLLEGVTIRGSGTTVDISTSYFTYSHTLSAAEANAITDYSNLIAQLCVTKIGGGPPSDMDITGMEFQAPDVGGGRQRTSSTVIS